MDGLEVQVIPKKLVYENEGYFVYGCVASKKDRHKVEYNKWGNFTITGENFPELNLEREYAMVLREDTKAKFSNSYIVVKFGQISIDNPSDQWDYLRSIVTQIQYGEIKSVYKENEDKIINIIRENKFDFQSVKGYGEMTYELLKENVEKNIEKSLALGYFSQFGMSMNAVNKIVNKYGTSEKAIQQFKKNPYLLTSIDGFGFIKVDGYASALGIEKNSPFRIESCIEYLLDEASNNGDTWIGKKQMLNKLAGTLELKTDEIEPVLDGISPKIVTKVDDRYGLTKNYLKESFIATKIIEMNSLPSDERFKISDTAIKEFEDEYGIELAQEQIDFIKSFENTSVSFLVGSAGSGKSMLMNLIIKHAKKNKLSFKLLSPTGKASKVLRNYTGERAHTIHKEIVMNQVAESLIEADVIIVDEASMCDISVLSDFFYNLGNVSKIVFVGDDAQIPSVGAGNFLYDCINSGVLDIKKLNKVFRQKEGGILDVATKTRQGEKFINTTYVGRRVLGKNLVVDTTFSDTEGKVLETYEKLYKSGKWASEDIVVLTPTNKGKLGTVNINSGIQEIVNPPSHMKSEIKVGDKIFREGDLVMNTVNDYKAEIWFEGVDMSGALDNDKPATEIFNGESGIIHYVNMDEKYIVVNIDGKLIKFDSSDARDKIVHAWCMTIHKCVTGDTWINTDRGLKQIKDLDNGASVGEFKKIKEDIKVFNGIFNESPSAFYNNGVDKINSITTSQGYNIRATDEHGLDVFRDGKISRVNAKDVSIGDKLVLSVGGNSYGNLSKLPNEWSVRPKMDSRTVIYERPSMMTKDFARFLGYMVADGTVARNSIKFSKRNKEVSEDFQRIVKELFNYDANVKYRKSNDYMCEVSSIDIANFCQNIEGIQPHDKFVPQVIMESPKEFQLEFLKCVFEDGSVNVKKRNNIDSFDHIELSAKGEELIRQIQILLLNMGIVTSMKKRVRYDKKYKKERTFYFLYLYKYESRKFFKEIGFVSHDKNEKLKYCMEDKNQRYNTSTNKYYIDKNLGLVYLDDVKSIEYSREQTYCLEMPITNKFVQNGFHAYNCQGSQFKIGILIADKSSAFQLNANLLYTGISRFQEYLLLLGQAKTINIALTKFANLKRNCFLQELLQEKALQTGINML